MAEPPTPPDANIRMFAYATFGRTRLASDLSQPGTLLADASDDGQPRKLGSAGGVISNPETA